jgi:hypothetical protein
MLRRLAPRTAALAPTAAVASRSHYIMGPFSNPKRRPQLSDEEREKVVIDQTQWPEKFRDYDPMDPYKKFPDYIEGMSSWSWWAFGVELSFIVVMWDMVFPASI